MYVENVIYNPESLSSQIEVNMLRFQQVSHFYKVSTATLCPWFMGIHVATLGRVYNCKKN